MQGWGRRLKRPKFVNIFHIVRPDEQSSRADWVHIVPAAVATLGGEAFTPLL